MDTKKEVKKYLNKYFKAQYINENDDEFKSLVLLINKAQRQVKNYSISPVIASALQEMSHFLEFIHREADLPSPMFETYSNLYANLHNTIDECKQHLP